jgi:hypothetical protein
MAAGEGDLALVTCFDCRRGRINKTVVILGTVFIGTVATGVGACARHTAGGGGGRCEERRGFAAAVFQAFEVRARIYHLRPLRIFVTVAEEGEVEEEGERREVATTATDAASAMPGTADGGVGEGVGPGVGG